MIDKSKLPNMGEITSMAGKLFKDVKKSVTEIVDDYKSKHPEEAKPAETVPKAEAPAPKADAPVPKAEEPAAKAEAPKPEASEDK